MKVRTIGEAQDRLDAEIAWRRVELHSILRSIRTSDGRTSTSLRRGGIALLYAHWEGYTKAALTCYWEFVAQRKLKYRELAPNFIALGIEAELQRQPELRDGRRLVERVQRILSSGAERALISNREVNTRSNLNSEVLHDLMCQLGLDPAPFDTKAVMIDRELLKARNQIAHGEYLAVTVEAYEGLHTEVMNLLELVKSLVITAISEGQYRSAKRPQAQGGAPPGTTNSPGEPLGTNSRPSL